MSVIGNRNRLAFQLVPVSPSWELRYGPERAAWAGLAIWAAGKNLCEHRYPGSGATEDYLYVPLGPIADWLVRVSLAIRYEERAALYPTTRDLHQSAEEWGRRAPREGVDFDTWLEAREEWWARHFLRAGADGSYLPDLALLRDDEELVISWAEPPLPGQDAPVMVNPSGQSSLPWDEGFEVLDEFVAVVARWFRDTNNAHVFRWASLDRPLRDSQQGLMEALPLFTGRPITELMTMFAVDGFDELMRSLRLPPGETDPGASAECQILRDLSPSASPEVGQVVVEAGELVASASGGESSRWGEVRRVALEAIAGARHPEQAGQFAATAVRDWLGLDGAPVGQVESVLQMIGLGCKDVTVDGGHDRMVVAAREGGAAVAMTLRSPRTETLWGRRFEYCRAVGHVLLDPQRQGVIGAASGPFAQDTRRRRSGAFAAELLLPEVALEKASGGALDGAASPEAFRKLLERYGVGATTAAYQLWNRGWLSSVELRDDLIDQFASQNPG
jgi:hypothetical protein